jgi:hypothetical protein
VPDAALDYLQVLADDVYAIGVVPKKLTNCDIVWHHKRG